MIEWYGAIVDWIDANMCQDKNAKYMKYMEVYWIVVKYGLNAKCQTKFHTWMIKCELGDDLS